MKRILAIAAIFLVLGKLAWAGTDYDPATQFPINELLPTESLHSAAYEPAHQIATGPGWVSNITINFHTAAYRTIMLFDSATTVAPGTVAPDWCFEGLTGSTDATSEYRAITYFGQPFRFHKGLYIAVSTNAAGCFTLTLDGSNDAFWWQLIKAAN